MLINIVVGRIDDRRWQRVLRYHRLKTGCTLSDHDHCCEIIDEAAQRLGHCSAEGLSSSRILSAVVEESCSCDGQMSTLANDLARAGWGSTDARDQADCPRTWLSVVRQLDPFDRTLVFLRDIEHLSLSSAAQVTGMEFDYAGLHSRCSRLNLMRLERDLCKLPEGEEPTGQCLEVMRDISLFWDGAVGQARGLQIVKHLHDCAPCRVFAQRFFAMCERSEALRPVLGEDLVDVA